MEIDSQTTELRTDLGDLWNYIRRIEDEFLTSKRNTRSDFDQINLKIHRIHKENSEERDTLRGIFREEIARVENETAAGVRLSKEIMQLFDENKKNTKTEIADIQRKTSQIDDFAKNLENEAFKRLKLQYNELNSLLQKGLNDLKVALNGKIDLNSDNLKANLGKVEIELYKNLQEISDNFDQKINAVLIEKIAALQTNLDDTNHKIDDFQHETHSEFRNFNANMQKNIDEIVQKLTKTEEKVVNSALKIEKLTCEIRSIQIVSKEHEELNSHILATKHHFESLLSTQKAEFLSANSLLKDLIESTSENIERYIRTESEMLRQRLMTDCERKVEVETRELKAKLEWLPLNLEDVAGMTPTEARLYTLEMRIRNEENRSISLYQTVKEQLEQIGKEKGKLNESTEVSPKAVKPGSSHVFHRHQTPVSPSSRRNLLLRSLASREYVEPAEIRRAAVTPTGTFTRIFPSETVRFERLLGER